MEKYKTNITVPAIVRAAKGPSLLAHKIVSENHLQGCQQLLSLACGILQHINWRLVRWTLN